MKEGTRKAGIEIPSFLDWLGGGKTAVRANFLGEKGGEIKSQRQLFNRGKT